MPSDTIPNGINTNIIKSPEPRPTEPITPVDLNAKNFSDLEQKLKEHQKFEQPPSYKDLQNIDIGDLHGDVLATIEVLERSGLITPLSSKDTSDLKKLLAWNKMDEQARLELMNECLKSSDPIAEFNQKWPDKKAELLGSLKKLESSDESGEKLLKHSPERLLFVFLAKIIEFNPEVEEQLESEGRKLTVTSLGDIFNKDSFGLQIVWLLKMVKDRSPNVKFEVILGNHDHRIISALGTEPDNQKALLAILGDVIKYGDVTYGESLFMTHEKDTELSDHTPKHIGGIDLKDWPKFKTYFKERSQDKKPNPPPDLLEKYADRLRKNLLAPRKIPIGFTREPTKENPKSVFSEVMAQTKIVDYDSKIGIMRFHGDPTEEQAQFILKVCETLKGAGPAEDILGRAIDQINKDYQTMNKSVLQNGADKEAWQLFNSRFREDYKHFILGSNVKDSHALTAATAQELAVLGVSQISHGHISDPSASLAHVRKVGPVAVVNNDISISSGTHGERLDRTLAGALDFYDTQKTRQGYSGIDSRGILRVYFEEEVSSEGETQKPKELERSQACLYFPLPGAKINDPHGVGELVLLGLHTDYTNLIFTDTLNNLYEVSPELFETLADLSGAAVQYDLLKFAKLQEGHSSLLTLDEVKDASRYELRGFDQRRESQSRLQLDAIRIAYRAMGDKIEGAFGGAFSRIYTSKTAALWQARHMTSVNYLTPTSTGQLKNFGVFKLRDQRYMVTNVTPFEINLKEDEALQKLFEGIKFQDAASSSPTMVSVTAAIKEVFGRLGIDNTELVLNKGINPQAGLSADTEKYTIEKLGDIITRPDRFNGQTRNEKSKQLSFALQQAMVAEGMKARVRLSYFGESRENALVPNASNEFRYVVEIPIETGTDSHVVIIDPTQPASWLDPKDIESLENPFKGFVHFYNFNNVWIKEGVPETLSDLRKSISK